MDPDEARVVELRPERSGPGPAVEGYFGSSDYEWTIVIAAENVAYVGGLEDARYGRDNLTPFARVFT